MSTLRTLRGKLRTLDCQRQAVIDAIETIERRKARRRLKLQIGSEVMFSQGCGVLVWVGRTTCHVEHWLDGTCSVDILEVWEGDQ